MSAFGVKRTLIDRCGMSLLTQSGHDRIPGSIPGVGSIGTNFRSERLGICWGATQPNQVRSRTMADQNKPSIVFAHGLWADGSCFQKLIPALQADGHEVMCSQHGLDS